MPFSLEEFLGSDVADDPFLVLNLVGIFVVFLCPYAVKKNAKT